MLSNIKITTYYGLWLLCCLLGNSNAVFTQQITGVWHGKIGNALNGANVELKLVQKGDSLVGTSYYYRSKNNWTRYSVKGYFNQHTNAVIWWDDRLIASKHPNLKLLPTDQTMLLVEANFDCPTGGTMRLEGEGEREGKDKKITIDFQKKGATQFNDEWDVVVDNWLVGGNSRTLIDSIQQVAFTKPEYEVSQPITTANTPIIYKTDTVANTITTTLELPINKAIPTLEKTTNTKPPIEFLDLGKPNRKIVEKADSLKNSDQLEIKEDQGNGNPNMGVTFKNFSIDSIKKQQPEVVIEKIGKPAKEISVEKPIEQKLKEREKVILATLPLADSMELHFYDNAEVDGDSISLFLNGQLLLEHIRLTDKPYVVKLDKAQLTNATELTMVAENLGSIPPNTSYMVAFIGGQRYTATLSSTEKSSAVIRFNKPK